MLHHDPAHARLGLTSIHGRLFVTAPTPRTDELLLYLRAHGIETMPRRPAAGEGSRLEVLGDAEPRTLRELLDRWHGQDGHAPRGPGPPGT
jgi:hypothetical protein